ncbi:hypothetical protein V6N11_058298 [Hibiscus sabdariffa]|uniref:Uncharacterized protein n=1 Tax=Hibiscus sabdariffa TaxID=183260 RepID=A0ABR2U3U4_9ROSI
MGKQAADSHVRSLELLSMQWQIYMTTMVLVVFLWVCFFFVFPFDKNTNCTYLQHKEREFILKFSAMEIYNESVKDLLSADNSPLRLLNDPENLFSASSLPQHGIYSTLSTPQIGGNSFSSFIADSQQAAILSKVGQQQQLDCTSADSQQPGGVANVLSEDGQHQQLGCSSADSQQHLEYFPTGLEVFPFASPEHDVAVTRVDDVVPQLALADDNVGRDVEVSPADKRKS